MGRWWMGIIASRFFAIAVWMWIRCREKSFRRMPFRTQLEGNAMRTELYWIEGRWPGHLAIMPRPRGGDWLEDEIQAWRRAGVDVVVSLLTPEEQAELGLDDEETLCRANGIELVSFPIVDRSIPSSFKDYSEMISNLADLIASGKNIAVHCRQGIGRAALVAICLIIVSGVEPAAAIERVGAARGCSVPETPEQRRWIADFTKSLVTELPK
jgi:protein-tyrosine phosphatase